MSKIQILVKTTVTTVHPAVRAVISVSTDDTLSKVYAEAGKALKLDLSLYSTTSVSYGEDAVVVSKDAGKSESKEQTIGRLGIKNESTLFFSAPPALKPPMQAKKIIKKIAEEAAEEKKKPAGTSANPYKDITHSEVFEKWTKATAEKDDKNSTLYFNYIEIYFTSLTDASSCKSFLKLNREQVGALISSSRLNASEGAIFDALCRWATYQMKEAGEQKGDMKEFLGDLIFAVRFPLMTTKEVAEIVAPKELLDVKVLVKLYSFIASKETSDDEKEAQDVKKQKVIMTAAGLGAFNSVARTPRYPPDFFKWDAQAKHSQMTLSGDNMTVTASSTSYYMPVAGDIEFEDGLHVWELNIISVYAHQYGLICGVAPASYSNWNGSVMLGYSGHIAGWGYGVQDGTKWNNGQQTKSTAAKAGDVVRFKLDMDKGEMWVYCNGVNVDKSNKPLHTGIKGPVKPCVSMYGSNSVSIQCPKDLEVSDKKKGK